MVDDAVPVEQIEVTEIEVPPLGRMNTPNTWALLRRSLTRARGTWSAAWVMMCTTMSRRSRRRTRLSSVASWAKTRAGLRPRSPRNERSHAAGRCPARAR